MEADKEDIGAYCSETTAARGQCEKQSRQYYSNDYVLTAHLFVKWTVCCSALVVVVVMANKTVERRMEIILVNGGNQVPSVE